MNRHRLLCAAALALTSPAPALAECLAKFDGATYLTLATYNPFTPVSLRARANLAIRNLSESSCQFRVFFTRTSASGEFGPNIRYLLTDHEGAELLTANTNPAESARSMTSPIIPAAGVSSLEFYLEIARGQISLPGTYMDTVVAVLYAADGAAELDRQPLRFTLPVASVSSVNIAGGGVFTSINFGKLEAGKKRSIILEARANEPYTIKFTSQHSGRLRLDPPMAGQDWSINYRMHIDGALADLANEIMLSTSAPASGEQSHTLSFEILDISGKRAGIYKDVVIATISAGH